MSERDNPDEGIRDDRDPARGRRDDYQDDYDRPRRRDRRPPPPESGSKVWLWVLLGVGGGCLLLCGGGFTLAYFKVQSAKERMTSSNNLKMIGIAVHSHSDFTGKLPQDIRSPDGKPLLSWRVAILPYIEQDNLYRQFRLDEPWDSTHNKRLLSQMPRTYLLPSRQKPEDAAQGLTYYQGFAGPNTVFDPKAQFPPRINTIPDGTSNTILVVEAGDPVPWTKPADLAYDPNGPPPPLKGHYSGRVQVLLCDGSVRSVSLNQPDFDTKLRAAVTTNDNQGFNLD